jgi:hypothetical protein
VDFLTHLCLPFTAAFVLRRDLLDDVRALPLAGFGLLSDFDKFLGLPGLLHSLVTLVPLALVVLGAERALAGELRWSPVVVALIGSHLVLDFVDGGPVPLLFPLVKTGVGLQYPIQTVFGAGPVGLAFEGSPVALRTTAPRPGHNTYGFIKGAGVASALLFLTVYAGTRGEAA